MTPAQTWVLPDGQSAEPSGPRRTDLLLAWPAEDSAPFDESHVLERWPHATHVRRIASNLFLVYGVDASRQAAPQVDAPGKDPPCHVAEQQVAEARRAANLPRLASALTDLGVLRQRAGDHEGAVKALEEAVKVARQAGDRATESDAFDSLGLAFLRAGQLGCARQLFEHELALARGSGDRLAEKQALGWLAVVLSQLGERTRAVECSEQGLSIARAVGDGQHEAKLLWQLAIDYAELGHSQRALARAEDSVRLLRQMNSPELGILAEHVEKYRQEVARHAPTAGVDVCQPTLPAQPFTGPFTVTAAMVPEPRPATGGPNLFFMALGAVQAAAKYLGSGLQSVPPETYQRRRQTCATCPHFTGLRCRVCGCFLSAKAWLPHESCPLGKWPSQPP